jgi:hypothetical protein
VTFRDTQLKISQTLGYFWFKVFTDQSFVEGQVTTLAVEFWELERMLQELPSYQSRYEIPLKDVRDVRLFLFDEATLERVPWRYGDALSYGPTASFGQQLPSASGWSYAIEQDQLPNFLSVSVQGRSRVLIRNVDYTVAEGRITFKENPLELAGVRTLPVAGEDEPQLMFLLWGFQVERDLRAVQEFFGVLAGVVADSTRKYQAAVNLAWDLRVDGASKRNTDRVLCFISDTDYVEQAGQVTDIFVEGDRWCVATENAVYTAPLGATVQTVKGASLQQGERIFDSYEVRYEKEEVDFEAFGGLLLDGGLLGPGYRSGIFIGNEVVPVTKVHDPKWTYVEPA